VFVDGLRGGVCEFHGERQADGAGAAAVLGGGAQQGGSDATPSASDETKRSFRMKIRAMETDEKLG
jgi:hypothetical protein